MQERLNAVALPGIRYDSLGGYLAGLGVLSSAATRWPGLRGCWRKGQFVLFGKALDTRAVEEFFFGWRPERYELWWTGEQKKDTKAKSDLNVWAARNEKSDIEVSLLDAHVVGAGKNYFNPVLGTGGNIGRRNLAEVHKNALELIEREKDKRRRAWLCQALFGVGADLPPLSGTGTWFVFANKTFNSGQDWYSEGQISPWSYLLAVKGAALLAGGSSRRISAARHHAVFPFVCLCASPLSEKEAGIARAEFWAPVWERPASLAAISALLARGKANVGARAASASSEFALATRSAQVDSGITEFLRFSLQRTTSAQTYEAIPQQRIRVDRDENTALLEPLSDWIRHLPRDSEKDVKIYGFRGRIERDILRIAEDGGDSERWRDLLLTLCDVQTRIDRNGQLRTYVKTAIPLLDSRLFQLAWPVPPAELSIATAVASIGALAGKDSLPIQANIFGVDKPAPNAWFVNAVFANPRPTRTVWNEAAPLTLLANVLERRLIDLGPEGNSWAESLRGGCCCNPEAIYAFVEDQLDSDLIAQWIPPLSLLNWSREPAPCNDSQQGQAEGEDRNRAGGANVVNSGGVARLLDFFQPFFHPYDILETPAAANGSPTASETTRAKYALELLRLIRQGEWERAFALGRRRYAAAGLRILVPQFELMDERPGELVAAALLAPISSGAVRKGYQRWVLPERKR